MKRKLLYLIKMVSKNLLYGLLLQCLFMTTLAAHEINAQIRPIDKSFIKLNGVWRRLSERSKTQPTINLYFRKKFWTITQI